MKNMSRLLFILVVSFTFFTSSSALGAGKSKNTPQPEPYGVGTTPAVYLVNFLLIYMANPNEAANMPAYRAPIPADLATCLNDNTHNPGGCTYLDYALSFDGELFNGSENQIKKCPLPQDCRTNPKWEAVAPPVAKHPSQINEPLGPERANAIAKAVGITNDMILTDAEWECTLGQPATRNTTQELIAVCLDNLTNSNGNTNIPLSSYGLAIDNAGNVQSLCAPQAPCLEFNILFYGPLEVLAEQCGWLDKFTNMTENTAWQDVTSDGGNCQTNVGGTHQGGACLATPDCD